MSYDSLLIHTCDISSYSEGDRDAYGNKVRTWTVVHESAPCRLVSIIGREVRFGAEVVISDWQLFVDDITITEHDRVSNILLASTGAVVDDSTFEVLLVQMRTNGASQHHREVYLQKVK